MTDVPDQAATNNSTQQFSIRASQFRADLSDSVILAPPRSILEKSVFTE
jgi:hypothetical protein